MYTPQPQQPAKPPWLRGQLPPGLRLPAMIAIVLLSIACIVALIFVIGSIAALLSPRGNGTEPTTLIAGAIALAVMLGGGYGVYLLHGYVSITARFQPTYAAVPPELLGHPFEARFRASAFQRALVDKGTVQFLPDRMVVTGTLAAHTALQVAIVVVAGVGLAVLLGVGGLFWGIILGMVVARYVGRSDYAVVIPYQAMGHKEVAGCKLQLDVPTLQPGTITFFVSPVDGERLYRELHARYPAILAGWAPATPSILPPPINPAVAPGYFVPSAAGGLPGTQPLVYPGGKVPEYHAPSAGLPVLYPGSSTPSYQPPQPGSSAPAYQPPAYPGATTPLPPPPQRDEERRW